MIKQDIQQPKLVSSKLWQVSKTPMISASDVSYSRDKRSAKAYYNMLSSMESDLLWDRDFESNGRTQQRAFYSKPNWSTVYKLRII